MFKLKKLSIFMVNFMLLTCISFKINALEKNSYLYDEKTKINKENQITKVKKGFTLNLKFKKPKNINFCINLADIVLKHLKVLLKENLNDNEYIKNIFKNYKISYNNKNYIITFYIYPPNGEYKETRNFINNNLLKKDFSDLFSEMELKNEDFDDFIDEYKKLLIKRYNFFIEKIIRNYQNNNYSKLYDIFDNISSNFASTSNVISPLSQDKKIKVLSAIIKDKLKIICNKKLKYKSRHYDFFNEYFYYDYNDEYDKEFFNKSNKFKDYFDDDEDEYDDLKDDDNYDKIFVTLEKNIISFMNVYKRNIKNLNELNYSDFKDILNTINFGNELIPIEKEITKFDGVIEKIIKR